MQRALIQYRNPENYQLVKEALISAHREDLIGFGEKCLIPPRKFSRTGTKRSNNKKKGRKKNENSDHNRSLQRNGGGIRQQDR